jgi:predicted PurR-regulated permease PerM
MTEEHILVYCILAVSGIIFLMILGIYIVVVNYIYYANQQALKQEKKYQLIMTKLGHIEESLPPLKRKPYSSR